MPLIPLLLRTRHMMFCGAYIRRAENIRHRYIVDQLKPLATASPLDLNAAHTIGLRAEDLVWIYGQMTIEREGLSAKVAGEIIDGDNEVPGIVMQLMANAMGNEPDVAEAATKVIDAVMQMRQSFQASIDTDYILGTINWLADLP